jgi:hypothetical protein
VHHSKIDSRLADGGIAVLCNACVEQPIVKVCVGYPQEGRRCSIDDPRFRRSWDGA